MEENANQPRAAYDAVIKMLDEANLKYAAEESELSVNIRFRNEDMPQSIYFDVKPAARVLRAQSRLPFTAKKDRMAELAEAVTRINCVLLVGNYDFDWPSGAILFGISQLYTGSPIGAETAKDMLGWLVTVTDRFNQRLLAVNMGYLKGADILKE